MFLKHAAYDDAFTWISEKSYYVIFSWSVVNSIDI